MRLKNRPAPAANAAVVAVWLILASSPGSAWAGGDPQPDVCPDGSCEFTSIDAAIQAADDGDTILIGPGVYTGSGNVVFNASGRSLRLVGIAGSQNTIIDGEGVRSGAWAHSTVGDGVTFEDLTFQNCVGRWGGDLSGGGIASEQGAIAVRRCRFIDNYAEYQGGAILLKRSSSANITDTYFLRNSVGPPNNWGGGGQGGAIIVRPRGGGSACQTESSIGTISRCVFQGNDQPIFVNSPGEIEQDFPATRVSDCVFLENTCSLDDAGIVGFAACSNTETIIESCRFLEAKAFTPSIIGMDSGSQPTTAVNATVSDCIFSLQQSDAITGPLLDAGNNLFGVDEQAILDDCNHNGLLDWVEAFEGIASDCNGNLIPDECDLNDIASLSDSRTPTSIADFMEFDVSGMSDAADVVTLDVSAVGDLATTSEFMFVYLDDAQIGLAFVADGASCRPVTNTFSIPAADWNAAGADGSRLVRISGVNIAPDACSEPSTSIRVMVPQPIVDCDANGVWDACDISAGDASDLDGNGVPDSCDPDCDGDGEPDGYEIASGQDLDCNGNLVPDACDLADGGSSNDVDSDGVPDECQPDCDADGLPDSWELAEGLAMDCNANGHPDNCDIADGTSSDIDANGTPDECKDDCNGNGIPDYWEILKGQVEDCDGNGIPDPCDISAGTLADCDLDGRWDECAIDDGSVTDCNDNRVPDSCDIEGRTDEDDNGNDIPDACEIATGDFNLDGCIDSGDLGLLIALWGIQNPPFGDLNGDGVIAAADLGLLIGNWTPCP